MTLHAKTDWLQYLKDNLHLAFDLNVEDLPDTTPLLLIIPQNAPALHTLNKHGNRISLTRLPSSAYSYSDLNHRDWAKHTRANPQQFLTLVVPYAQYPYLAQWLKKRKPGMFLPFFGVTPTPHVPKATVWRHTKDPRKLIRLFPKNPTADEIIDLHQRNKKLRSNLLEHFLRTL
jgi:hypothetical protein